MGAERQKMKVERAKAFGRETTVASGRYLMRESISKFSEWLDAWKARAKVTPGPNHSSISLLELFSSDVVSFIVAQAVIDGISTTRTHHSICFSIGRRLEDERKYDLFSASDKGMWEAMLRTAKKIKSYEQFRKTVDEWRAKCGCDAVCWTSKEKLSLGQVLLFGFIQSTGMIEEVNTTLNGKTKKNIQATPETLRWLTKSNAYHEALFPYYLPTVIPPAPWRGLRGGGYHSDLVINPPLIRLKWSSGVSLESLEGADLSEVLPAVNAVQDSAWTVNVPVFEVMKHFYSLGTEVAGLPTTQDMPFPEKPDVAKDTEEWTDYRRACGRTNSINKKYRAARLQLTRSFFVANRFADKDFWFPFFLDSRGRFYPVPMSSPLQPQGPKYARALLTFSEGKPITTKAQADTLAIHGANVWGEDKVPFGERVSWVSKNSPNIRSVYEDPISCTWWTGADDEWGFLAFCLEWGAFLEHGYGYMSSLPVAADGSNNGLQIYSLLMRDPIGAGSTNCIPSDTPKDIYQDVADLTTQDLIGMLQSDEVHHYPLRRTEKEAGMVKTSETYKSLAAKWLSFCSGAVPRKATKRPVMTLPYGLKRFSALQYVAAWYREMKAEGWESPWGDSDAYLPCLWFGNLIWDNIEGHVIEARKAMDWLRDVASTLAENNVIARWTAPSGFPVTQAYPRMAGAKIRNKVGDTMRVMRYRKVDDGMVMQSTTMQNGLPPNFVHSLDAACTVKTINRGVEEGISSFAMIHDSYATVAADAPALQRITREVYADVFSENLLEDLRVELQALLPADVILPNPPPQGSLDPSCVINSLYFFQ